MVRISSYSSLSFWLQNVTCYDRAVAEHSQTPVVLVMLPAVITGNAGPGHPNDINGKRKLEECLFLKALGPDFSSVLSSPPLRNVSWQDARMEIETKLVL